MLIAITIIIALEKITEKTTILVKIVKKLICIKEKAV